MSAFRIFGQTQLCSMPDSTGSIVTGAATGAATLPVVVLAVDHRHLCSNARCAHCWIHSCMLVRQCAKSCTLLLATLCLCTNRLKKTKQHDKHKHSSVHVMQQSDCQHLTIKLNCAVSVMSVQGGCQIHSAVVCVVCALIGELKCAYPCESLYCLYCWSGSSVDSDATVHTQLQVLANAQISLCSHKFVQH
jgi:hypothetical protein